MESFGISVVWVQWPSAIMLVGSLASVACDDDPPGPENHIAICHRAQDNPHDGEIIEVPESSVQEHLDHGDSLPPCGALVRVTVDSTVGVLLDELPEPVRDRAADSLLEEDEAFWHERIEDQLRLTLYQLTLRPLFYINRPEQLGSLWLPPEEVWNVTLDPGGAQRRDVDGHDYVAIDYTLDSTLLSDEESTCAAEPALCDVGGTWNELFVLPVDADPQLMTARMRYACICEDGLPVNNIFGPTAWFYYNQYTQACPENVFPCACHQTEPTEESCFQALDNHIGSVATSVHFERVPWDPDLADQVRHGELSPTAELRAVAEDLDETWLTYRYIAEDSCEIAEECVSQPGWRRLLNFSANSINLGREPLFIGAIEDGNPYLDHNAYHFSDCHEHYHFNHYADYRLGDEGVGHKQGFCIIGTSRLTNTEHTPLAHDFYTCDYQGIPAGWGDEYVAGLSCQWVDVTGVDTSAGDVDTSLSFELNPNGFLCEGTAQVDDSGAWEFEVPQDSMGECAYRGPSGACEGRPVCEFADGHADNNLVATDVTLPARGSMVTAPCRHGQIGPMRDCGFTLQEDHIGCTPGDTVTLSCTVDDAAAVPQALRLCEVSQVLGHGLACEALYALATAVIDPEDSETLVELTCPTRRDDFEPGGQYAMYVAPLLASDPLQTVSCTPVE